MQRFANYNGSAYKTTVIVLFWCVGEKLGWTISNISNAFKESHAFL